MRNPIVRNRDRGIRRYYRPSFGRKHRHEHGDGVFTHRHVSDYYDYSEIHEPGVAYTRSRTLGGRFTGLPLGAVATAWQERELPRDREFLSSADLDLDYLDQDDLDIDDADQTRSKRRSSLMDTLGLDYLHKEDLGVEISANRSRSRSKNL